MGGIGLLLIGVYASLVGFKVISVSKKQGEEYDKWYLKWGSKLKIVGPLLIIIGITMTILK